MKSFCFKLIYYEKHGIRILIVRSSTEHQPLIRSHAMVTEYRGWYFVVASIAIARSRQRCGHIIRRDAIRRTSCDHGRIGSAITLSCVTLLDAHHAITLLDAHHARMQAGCGSACSVICGL